MLRHARSAGLARAAATATTCTTKIPIRTTWTLRQRLVKSVEEAIPEHINSLLEQHSDRFDLTTAPAPLPRETVFCNRELRMDEVQVIGFDYDYTIASYKWTLQALIYDQAKKYLLERLRYPAELSLKSYDRDFAIRGLLFDKHRGVLLKLSYAQQISPDTAFRGRRRLSEDELKTLYGEALHVDPVYVASHMTVLNDLFSLSEACLLADVLQLAIDADIAFDAASLGEDVRRAEPVAEPVAEPAAEPAAEPGARGRARSPRPSPRPSPRHRL